MKMSNFWATQMIYLIIHLLNFMNNLQVMESDGKNRILAQASSNPTEKYKQQINHNTNWQNPRKDEIHWSLCLSWAKIWPFRNNWYFSKSPNIERNGIIQLFSIFHSNLFSSLLCCFNPYISKHVSIIVLKFFLLLYFIRFFFPFFLIFRFFSLSQNRIFSWFFCFS